MDEKPKKMSVWDGPSTKDAFGRRSFVETIVNTIKFSDEGFNLGISARWGEGKSSILDQLEPLLVGLNYKVLKFSPWKYTQDQISIKRKFIIDIYSQLNKPYDDSELYSSTEINKSVDPEELDKIFVSRAGTFFRYFSIMAILFLLALYGCQQLTGIDINITQIFLTNLFIPVLVGIVPFLKEVSQLTLRQVLPRIESAEQFEKLFNKVIGDIMSGDNPPEKIIIFVDDLDRCNHSEVEQTLTALFTFFNNKKCTYIITADHIVIRRYIGNFLHLNDELDENGGVNIKKTNDFKQKEATEYLKKIFQINFILPKIPNNLLEKWLEELICDNKIIQFHNPYAKDYLVSLMLNNFQGNPRKIKHFIRTLTFQLEVIDKKIRYLSETDDDEKEYLKSVQQSPELLAKILIIQDRFPNFYDLILETPKLIKRHEEGEIANDEELQNLLAQEPKFFNSVTRGGDYKTIDPYCFIHFSGSTGFGENKVVDPSEIKSLAKIADFESLTKIISGLTDAPRNSQVEHIKSEFDNPQVTDPEKTNIVRSIFHVVSLIEEPTLRLQKMKDVLSEKKYLAAFASLQSVDFAKVMTFVDIEIINKLLNEEPFTSDLLQSQIANAFISKQTEINDVEISSCFIELISKKIKETDTNQNYYIALSKNLLPSNFTNYDTVQDSLIEVFKNESHPNRYEALEVLLDKKIELKQIKSQAFEAAILSKIEMQSINEVLKIVGFIPSKINKDNFNIPGLVSSLIKRIYSATGDDFEQVVNLMAQSELRDEFGIKNVDKIILAILKVFNEHNENKSAVVRNQIPDYVNYFSDKKVFFNEIISIIANESLGESVKIMNILQGMSDYWKTDIKIKTYFINSIKKLLPKIKNIDIREAVSNGVNTINSLSSLTIGK